MTNVAEFIAYLQTLPKNANIEVVDSTKPFGDLVNLTLPLESEWGTDFCMFDDEDNTLRLGLC
jgi:hypothetical protein